MCAPFLVAHEHAIKWYFSKCFIPNYTFSGILGGTTANENNFNLVKSGTGTMTLSGANTYSGTTTINGGTVSVGTISNGFGSGTSAIALSGGTISYTGNNASFTRGLTVSSSGGQIETTTAGKTLTLSGTSGNVAITNTGNFTVGGVGNTAISTNITGSGGVLTKTGTGTLTLSGSNTYTGATNIRNGTLALGVDNGVNQTATLTLGDAANTNGVLRLNGFLQTLSGLNTAGAGTGNRVTGGSTTLSNLTVNSGTFGGILGGTGTNDNNLALTKSGTGTLALTGTSTYTGGTTITGGILSINNNAALGANSSSLTFNGAGSTTLQLTADIAASALVVNLTTTGTIDTGTFSMASSGVFSGVGGLTKSGSGTLTLSGANTYQGTTSITNGTLALSGGAAIRDDGAVSISNLSGANLLLNANETIGSLAGGGTSGGNVNLRASTLTVGANNTSTDYAGVISGTGSLNKTGTGTLTLSRSNTYTGATSISAGTLAVSGGNAISDTSAVVLSNTAGANLLLNANETIGSLAGGGAAGGNVNLQSFTLTSGGNNTSTSYAGVISGTGGFSKSGTGTLTLMGTNTYSGQTSVTGGTLALSGGSALADTSAVVMSNTSGAILLLNASETIGSLAGGGGNGGNVSLGSFTLSAGANNSSTTYSGTISGTGGLTKVGTGALTLARANTYTGTTTISAGSLIYGTDNALNANGGNDVSIGASGTLDINGRQNATATLNRLTGTGIVTNNSATTANLTLGGNNTSSTFNGSLQNGVGLLTLTKTGTGTLTLTPETNNGFSGNIIINGGALQAGNNNAFNSAGSNVVTFGSGVASGTKLQVNGNAVTIAGLASGSTTGSPVVENANAAAGTLTINNAAGFTYAGVIQDGSGGGALSLVKNGSGTQILSGVNTYTGSTQILGGTLSIRADSGLGTAPATATAGHLTINGGTLQIANVANDFTLNANRGIALGPVNADGSGTIEVASVAGTIRTITYGGIIANNGTGADGLVKTGLGNLALSGVSNTYSGGTTINAGLLSVTSTAAGALGENISTNNIAVNAGGNLSLSATANKGDQQTITVNSSSTALGGIGFSSTTLGQTALSGMFIDNTNANGGKGGVLSINTTGYNSTIDLSSGTGFGSSAGKGYWYLGSASSGTFTGTAANLTVGADSTYRLGGGGGTLTMSQSNVLTGANSVLVGSGLANGNGTVIVSLAQNYSGATTVTGGAVLSIANSDRLGTRTGAGSIVLDGGTLRTNTSFTLTDTRGIALGSATGSATGTLDADSSRILTYGGIITDNGTGADNLAKTGSGTVVLTNTSINTYSGSTEINAGTLEFSRIENLGTGTAINFGGGTLRYATGNTADITARTVTFGSGGGTINTNGNNVSFANATQGTGSFSKSGAGTLTLNAVNAMGNVTVSEGTLKMGVAQAIPATSQLILNSGATTAGTFDINGFDTTVMNLAGTTNTVLGKVINSAVGTSKTLTTNVTSTNTFSGILADNNGSGGTLAFRKTGTAALTLNGPNTYTGGTTISAGPLNITADASLGGVPATATPGNITIASGATLGTVTNSFEINANRGIAIDGNTAANISVGTGLTLTYNGVVANTTGTTGGLTKSDTTGTLILGGANTYAGTTTVSGGTLKIGNAGAIPFGPGAGNVSIASNNSGRIDLNGYNIVVNGLSGAGGITSTVAGPAGITVGANDATGSIFSGVISNGSGTVSLGKIGTGTLTLSGTNTYSGGTTISGGTLTISSDANIGAVPGVATPSNIVINGGILATSASMTLNANRGIAVGPGSGSGTATLTPANNTTLTYNGIIIDNGSGTGGLTKGNTNGTLVLGGVNSYSGDTTVSGGTLQLANVTAIPSSTGKGNLSLATGATLDLNNLSPIVNGLSGSGTVTNSLTGAVTFTAGANDATSAFSGVIQNGNGTVAFTKTGTGKLTLSGNNAYSGDTTINAGGTLEIVNATSLPSGSGRGNVIVNGTLDMDTNLTVNGLSGNGTISTDMASALTLTAGANDQTSTFAGNIINGSGGGSLGLTKTGTGTLTLSGTNTYSGATTISNGTLKMGSATGLSSNSTLTISGPGFLDINGYNVAMDGLLGTGTILNNGLTDATLTAGAAGGSTSFGGVIADGSKAISLNKSGAGTLTLTGINTYSGTTTIANGTLSVANIAAGGNLGSGTAAIILGADATKGTLSYTGTADLTYSRGFTVNAGGGEINTTVVGKTLTLQEADIVTAGNFTVSGAGNALVQSAITGSGGLTKANTGSMILSAVNTYSGDTTISTGTLQVTTAAAIPSGTGNGNVMVNGTLDVNNLSLTLNGLSGSGFVTNSVGTPVTLTLGGNNASGNFTGVILDGSGTTSLGKIGTGIQTLGGANTYSGNTTISAGTLQYGNAAAIPSGSSKGNVALAAGATLDLNDFEASINGLSGSGLVTNNSGASTLSVGNNNQGGTFSGSIRDGLGTIGLTKTGTGVLTLSGNNTFSGATTISQGTLSMGSNAGLSAASTLTIENAGALDLNGQVITIDGLAGTGSIINNNLNTPVTLTIGASDGSGTFGGTINDGSGVIGLTKTGSGTVTLSNVNSYSGGTTVTGGLLAITSTGALGAIPATPTPGNIVLNGGGISAKNTFEINANRGILVGPASGSGSGILDAAQNQTLTYNGIIADNSGGTGGLTKTGLGTVTLGGANTYSGDTTISSGALQVGNALAISSGSGKGNVSLAAGSTLDLNNFSITLNGLSGDGTVSNTKAGSATLSVGANDQTSTFNGLITDGNGTTTLNKVGTGVLTLTSTNDYTGGTTISAGKLSIASSGALGLESNNLTIGSGAALQVTDSFNTSRSTTLGGTPGAETGGTFEVATGKTLTYTSSSVISGTGSLIKTGEGTLALGGVDTYEGGTYIKEGTFVATSGQAAGPQPTPGSNDYAYHIYDGATLQIAVGSWATERQIELVGDTSSTTDAAKIDITNGFTQQRNGLIYGNGALDLVGTGTMIVTNANTYTGGTSITNGVLQVSNSSDSATGTGAVTVGSGGTLKGSATAGSGIITGAVTVASGGTLQASSVMSGSSTLTLGGLTLKDGSLSTFQLGALTTTPLVTITGTDLFALPASGLSTIDIINTGAMSANSTYHLFDYNGTEFTDISNLKLASSHTGLFRLSLVNNKTNTSIDLGVEAMTQQWKKGGENTNWSSEGNWWTGVVPNDIGADALFIDNFGYAGFGPNEAVTLSTDVKVGSIIFKNPTTAFTLNTSTGNTLTLDEEGNDNAVIQVFNTIGATHQINVPVILNDNLHVVLASGLDISGAISGEGKTLTKSATGVLTLSGTAANTYSGLTEVVEGTLNLNKSVGVNAIGGGLQIDSGGTVALLASNQIADATTVTVNGTFALGTYSETIAGITGGGNITTGDGSVLTLQSAANTSFLGVISGTGGIAKAGTGTLTLNGVNTYTGGTAINGGILQVGADHNLGGSTGGLAFDSGTLAFSDGFASARNIVLNSGGGTLDTDNNNVVLTGLISGAGTLTKTGLGTLTLNTANPYTGATVIDNGILQIAKNTALGTGHITVNPNGELEFNGDGLTTSNPLTLAGGEICTSVGTNTYTGPIKLTANSVIDADSDKLIITGNIGEDGGSFGLTKKGPGIVELTGTNTYTGTTHVTAGTLSLSNGAAIADTGAIILDDAPGVKLLLNASETIGSLAGGGTTGGNVDLATFTLTTGDASDKIFAGVISGAGGSLTKQGDGTLTLSGANDYTGQTTVNAGALNIQNATALGTSAGGTTVATGAALQLQGNLTVGAEALSLNGTGIGSTGALRNISGNNTYGGLLTLGSATRINSDAGSLTLSNTGTLTGSYDLTVGGAGDTTIRSIIGTESGTLTKVGSGILTLSGANTYAGGTTVTAGTLRMDNEAAIPSGTGKGNLSLAGSATLDLNNTRVTVNGLFGTGLVTNTQTGTAAITVGANQQTSTFDGTITDGIGTTALTKTGTGVLTLTGSNHYSGGTTIAAGTLSVSADSNLGTAPSTIAPDNLVIGAGATLATSATFALDHNRGVAVGPTGAGVIEVAVASVLTYGGAIADNGGSGGFTKAGSGTLVLSGNSSYTGATTVSAGLLTVNGSIEASSGTVVKSSGTLSGTGTISSLTVEASGTLAPGDNGIGTLAVDGGLVLGGIANFELGTPGASHASPGQSDHVAVIGNVVYGGTLNLSDNANAGGLGSAGAGSYRLITYSGTATGNFDVVNGLPAFHNALRDVSAEKALYIDMYNYAVATVTPAVDLGRIHAGGSFDTRALTVGNSASAGDFTESLGGVFGTTADGFTSSGSVTGIAGQANNTSNMIVGISDNTAGQKSGTIGVNFTSQAVNGSGLGDTALASQNVTVSGFAYTGQSTWTATGGGSWGNNSDDDDRWDLVGCVPGLDGALSVNDTATFGTAITAPATVSLDGASPSLKAVAFNSTTSYTLAQGLTGGVLTLQGSGGPATLTVANGSHSISAPVVLGSDANLAITQAADTLTVSGTLSGAHGIAKTGAGTLLLSGANSFTGHTKVDAGTLALTGSLADTAVTVAGGATLTGAGTIGNSSTKAASLSVLENGTHAPGLNGPDSQAINGTANYAAGSIFAWDLKLDAPAEDPGAGATNQGAYDHVAVSGALTGTDATFQVALGGTSFSDNFWNTDKHWDVFSSGAGSTDLKSIFTAFAGTDIAPTTGLVSGQGQFSFTGNTLNWSAVPEPTSTLVGLLIGAGLLRRQRKERPTFPPAGPPPVFQRCRHPR